MLLVFSFVIAFKELYLSDLWHTPGIDFGKHYEAAQRVWNGKSPFTGELYLSFNYPQFVAWMSLPLLLFPDIRAAEKAWDLFNVFLIFLTTIVVIFGFRPRPSHSPEAGRTPLEMLQTHWWVLGIFLTFFFHPNTDGLVQGNLSPWVLVTMTLLGWMVITNRETGIGVMIALCSLVKLMPFLLVIPYLAGWRKKVLRAAGIVWGIYFAVLLVTGTWKYEWYYITKVIPDIGPYWHYVSYSFPYVLMRIISRKAYDNPVMMKWVTNVWVLGMIGSYIMICFSSRRRIREEGGHALFFALGTLLLPLVPPLLEYHHFVWFFPGMVIIILYFLEHPPPWTSSIPILILLLLLSIAGPMADVLYFESFSLIGLTPVCGLILYILLARLLLLKRTGSNT